MKRLIFLLMLIFFYFGIIPYIVSADGNTCTCTGVCSGSLYIVTKTELCGTGYTTLCQRTDDPPFYCNGIRFNKVSGCECNPAGGTSTCYDDTDCGVCQKCDLTNNDCVADATKNGQTCTGCAGGGACECQAGICTANSASTTSGKAVFKIRKENCGLLGCLERYSIDRMACASYNGIIIDTDNSKDIVLPDGDNGHGSCDNAFSGAIGVICGFYDSDNGDTWTGIRCCKISGANGETISLEGTGWIEPDGEDDYTSCPNAGVAVMAKQGGYNGQDGVHAVYCAKILINGGLTMRTAEDSNWLSGAERWILCGSGGGGGSTCNYDNICNNGETYNTCPNDCGCNNNSICESNRTENIANCAFDCAPCANYILRNDSIPCEFATSKRGVIVQHPQCRWCATTLSGVDNKAGNPYPYLEPNVLASTSATDKGFACVNITNDPFNCGKCGFNANKPYANQHMYSDADGGFCRTNTPFCVLNPTTKKGECKASGDTKSYLDTHTDANPYYTDYSVSCQGSGCKASVGGVDYSYAVGKADADAAVCSLVAGPDAYDSELGCCGDNKCRTSSLDSKNSVKYCAVGRVCDGSKWHVASDEAAGEVFSPSSCFNKQVPIANINNKFVKCVDSDIYYEYALSVLDAEGCIPNRTVEETRALLNPSDLEQEFLKRCNQFIANHPGIDTCASDPTKGGEATGLWPYSCLDNYKMTGSVRVYGPSSVFGTCGLHKVYEEAIGSSDAYLVCVAGSSTNSYAFASIIDGGVGSLSYKNVNLIRNALGNDETDMDAFCPPAVSEWKDFNSGRDVSVFNNALIPCPGMKKITGPIEGGLGIALTGVQDAGPGKLALLCTQGEPWDGWHSGLYTLDFMRGNGTVMGNVSGREYLCVTDYKETKSDDKSRAKIAVCCGQQGCDGIPGNIGAGGLKMGVGDALNVTNTTTLYCRADGTWSEDLDYNDTQTQEACAKKFLATGNYCCSEADDTQTWINESYNDPGSSKGACFKGQPQNNGNLLNYKLKNSTLVTHNNVMIYNGTFMGCGFNITNFTAEMDMNNQALCRMSRPLSHQCIESIENWPNPGKNFTNQSPLRTNKSLIQNTDYCTLLNTSFGGFYCAYSNNWTDSLGENLSHKSEVPIDLFIFMFNQTVESIDPALKITNFSSNSTNLLNMTNLTLLSNLTPANCCLPNECWDPLAGDCIPGQGATQYYRINESTAYQCLQGIWISVAEAKRTPDGCYIGICPNATQCFYNQAGDPQQNDNITPGANPQCLANGQYIKDNLCMNGSWVSRTKMLAQKLVSLVGSEEFTLMCGPPSVVLNNFRQNLGDSNNFCTIDLGGQRIIGTTLNQPLINTTSHADFLTALEQNFLNLSYKDAGVSFSHTCTAQTKDFTKCIDISDSAQDYLTLYYDDDYQMVLMSNTDINGLTPSLGDKICTFIPPWLKWLCPSPPDVEKNMEGLQLFQKLYAADFNNKQVFGVAEQTCDPTNLKKTNLYTFNYTGFTNIDLKYMINQLEASNTTITPNSVLVLNPKNNIDPWAPMTLLRNPGQQ